MFIDLVYFICFIQEKNLAVINAAFMGMGLLTNRGPPDWHPAGQEIKDTCLKAVQYCKVMEMLLCF